ncbi:MAG TPA: VOC family protein [Marmoricola sp.]|nr:VOC family protein [Marmoricola sp.]
MLPVSWMTAFLDLPADEFDPAVAFWQSVTGYALSAYRGEREEFATLVPPRGDAYLRVQQLESGRSGVHLDLHAPGQAFEVRRSPGGLVYCLVAGVETVRPAPTTWGDGNRSQVDQVCLDIPPALWDDECAFWAEVTGWELLGGGRPEFRRLRRPEGQPLHVLLQRLDDAGGQVRAHLDLAADDRVAEVRRHELLGARAAAVHDGWTVMRPPAGPVYCITDRVPLTAGT